MDPEQMFAFFNYGTGRSGLYWTLCKEMGLVPFEKDFFSFIACAGRQFNHSFRDPGVPMGIPA